MVPIIIPFFREHEKLAKCKAAIAAQTHPGCEVFVRDNTHDNILYTAAVNEGLGRYCYRPDVDYVVVLNQDAYMDPDCVQRLVEYMDAHPECGVACPLQVVEPAPGAARGAERRVTWGGSLQAWPTGVHKVAPLASYREPFDTFWANGACMMIRAQTVREVGQFDRNMRFICSDADFSFTARARGWKVAVVPQALCEHGLGASGSAGMNAIELVKLRDVVYFTEKWLTGGLYRSLAQEGAGLTAIAIRQTLGIYRREIARVERILGERPARESDAWPSWTTRMRVEPPKLGAGR